MELRITQAIGRGDRKEAIRLLAAAHGTALLRYLSGMVGSEAQAEELLQETLIEALNAMAGYRGEAKPRAWLFGIGHRVCCQHLRKRDRQRGLWRRWQAPPNEPSFDASRLAEDRDALRWALERLEPGLRDVVLMRHQAGMDGPEIAAALGVSHAAARQRVSQGIRKLRELLHPLLMMVREDDHHGEANNLRNAPGPRLVRP
jgi:RNA polymerase sigma-70 factor (ECF subfamily)